MIAALFAVWTVWVEFYRAARVRSALTDETGLRSAFRLVARNRRRYGGYIVHLAVAVIAMGIAGSSTYHVDAQVSMTPGQSLEIADYRLTYTGLGVRREDQGRALYANLIVQQGSRVLGEMRPSALFYDDGEAPSTQVALYEQPLRDLYVVLMGTGQGGAAVLDIHVNPLVDWIWWGGDLFILGTLISLWPERRRHAWEARRIGGEVPFTAPVYEELAELEYDYGTGKLDPTKYEHMRRALIQRLESQDAAWRAVREELLAELRTVSSSAATLLEGGDRS
jgi:cytochrome c-type biogenesis protein CcmF